MSATRCLGCGADAYLGRSQLCEECEGDHNQALEHSPSCDCQRCLRWFRRDHQLQTEIALRGVSL